MTDQFLRFCSVTLDSLLDVSTLRCRFKIEQGTMLTPNTLKLMITNPLPARAQAIVKQEYKHIKIDAGYQSNHGVIFQGNIIQAIYGRESPTDTLLTIYAGDGDHGHNYATTNTVLPPGSTPQQHVDVAMQALGKYGISKGFIGVDLSTPTYSRAVTLVRMARTILTNVAKGKQATVSYQQEKVTMVQNGQSVPGAAIVLNSRTGLIGIPTQTIQGIMARCLINPNIHVHAKVQIAQADIQGGTTPINFTNTNELGNSQLAAIAADGIYTVYKVDIDGDTRGNNWYQDIGCVDLRQANPGQKEAITNYLGAN
jgi:hypothetical protein